MNRKPSSRTDQIRIGLTVTGERAGCEPLRLVAVQFCLRTQEAQDVAAGKDPL